MKKTAKQFDVTAEHYYVPAALFLLNINVVHLIYAYATFPMENRWEQLTLISFAAIALTGSIVAKNKLCLLGAMAFYLFVLIAAF
ncbi:hypothetical protein GCM10011386_15080 [Parapedobacter defluvii]|uniref:Uncharacterized protein n=1 Tax=Parapedobacter defluvii TaxID=2045106 RepID=A0ABQ1LGA3_9SPHI|nr:hypothetical protein [Parapedobacter defluvii]RQP16800.1 MAG: hypothetical protein EAS52_10710 [Parapedobacter sp.]GGC24086.1 hypothetical protein GCM10011386_15080 [Parapedobacter defluvii]